MHWRYQVDYLNLCQSYLARQWYLDLMPAWTKSITHAQGSWVVTNGKFTEVYPKSTNSQENAKVAWIQICQDVGIPECMKSDGAPKLCGPNSAYV